MALSGGTRSNRGKRLGVEAATTPDRRAVADTQLAGTDRNSMNLPTSAIELSCANSQLHVTNHQDFSHLIFVSNQHCFALHYARICLHTRRVYATCTEYNVMINMQGAGSRYYYTTVCSSRKYGVQEWNTPASVPDAHVRQRLSSYRRT